MSQENVEIVRRLLAAWERGDFDTALSFYDEDCVFYPGELAAGRAYRGRAGVARYFDEWIGAFTGFWIETDQFLDAGDQVVQLLRAGGKGKSSGVPVEYEGAVVYTLHDGKIVRGRAYDHQAEALEALGLSE